jgi:uncharacterized protein
LLKKLFKQNGFNYSRQWVPLPAYLFEIEDEYYVFDSNQVRFLEVSELIFKILSFLKQKKGEIQGIKTALSRFSADEIETGLKQIDEYRESGYFKPMVFQRKSPYNMEKIKEMLNNQLKGIFLNVTSRCNLACSYCILGGDYDNHSALKQELMSWGTAKKAIDFFTSRADTEGIFRIDFFGGEPLLAFPLIEKATIYLNRIFKEREQEVMYSITSNGTIMNDRIIDFLVENDVLFQFSIDGEKELHDLNRKFKNNDRGSFDTILENLQAIHDRNQDYFNNRIRLKSVLTTEALDNSSENFFKIPIIRKLIERKRYTVINQTPHYDLKKDDDFFERIHKLGDRLLQKRDSETLSQLLDGLNYKSKNMFMATFYDFFGVQVVNYLHFDLDKPVPFKKDCMIGIEGSVNCDGSISICYSSDTFVIGNVHENTWYFDKIESYHQDRYGMVACEHCYVQRFCELCYEKLNADKEKGREQLNNFCNFQRRYFQIIFEYMLRIMKNNPLLWDELNRITEESKNRFLAQQQNRKIMV